MACFGQNCVYWGDTVEKVITAFTEECSDDFHDPLIIDINNILKNHPNDLDFALKEITGGDFDAQLWGHTAESFLKEVLRLLNDEAPKNKISP